MFHRSLTLLVILALLMFGGATLAQEATTFCGDLAEADCALLTQADGSLASLQSGSLDFSMNFTMTNIPDAPSAITVAVTGSGSASGMGAFQSLSDMDPETDPSVAVPQLLSALEAFNGDLSLNITVPAELAEGGPNSIDLNLLWIDGVGYIDFDALQPVINDSSVTGWGGLEIVALVREALAQQPELLDQLSEMSEMSTGGSMDPEMFERFSDPEFAAQYMTITRAADENGLAVFETNLDFGAFANDPAFQEIFQQQMQMQMQMQSGMSGTDMSAADVEQMSAMMSGMFQDATFIIRQAIDPATGFTNNISANMVMDMTAAMEASGESIEGPGPVVNFDFSLNFSNFDSAPLVTAPADANLFPYQMLLGMLGNMMEATPAQ